MGTADGLWFRVRVGQTPRYIGIMEKKMEIKRRNIS